MTFITSALSPGYLKVNSNYIENTPNLRRQYRNAEGKSEIEPDKVQEETAVELDSVSNERPASGNNSRIEKGLSEKDKAVISELEKNEREVIMHESAHISAGGRFASSPKYTHTLGPDGKSYITGGEVSISTPSSSDPKEVIRMMEQVRKAALAPMNPSSQDLNVAAMAANAQAQAATQLAAHQSEWDTEQEPSPSRNNDRTGERIHSGHKGEHSGITSTITFMQEESFDENQDDLGKLAEHKSIHYSSKAAPEDNLYYTRVARNTYLMASSSKGLWTNNNGYEKISLSPALLIAQSFSIAA